MYNRYIPQPDGSYRRSRVGTPTPEPEPQRQPQPVQTSEPECPPEPPKAPPPPPPKQQTQPPSRQSGNAGDFLRQLLPKNLDTGDLLIIVLLLLMSADCQEDRNTALLTLALYMIM